MKYKNYDIEDFITDEYFLRWVLDPDAMTNMFWENWLADYPNKKEEVDKAKRLVMLMNYDEDKLSSQDFDAMWRNIIENRRDTVNEIKLQGKAKNRRYFSVAAVFLGLFVSSIGLYLAGAFSSSEKFPIDNTPQITLQLQDGTIKVLDDTSSNVVANANGNVVVRQEQNVLHYEDKNEDTKKLEYNELAVPYGKKFELLLSDGTHVFLNSGSKLRYPVNFLKDTPRDVYLDGEAYFSVEKDKARPFTVMTHDMNTRVHGTEFNVSSYKNENNTSTVLIEGSVDVTMVNGDRAGEHIMIQPGERAVYENNVIDVAEVNVEKYISWKDGKLLFEDDPFYLMVKELERHFNVEIDNRYEALNGKKFTGTFGKESLDQILQICQEHTAFSYSVEGSKITITEKRQVK
ncbi:FecR domain-containing protein [Arenibacter sp. F26102]|uniref:FecR family protein n=1 Tax=Arenibacter sp. F26102 TaxID=2926416 RepID=UPI001FF63319|nr:FecR domain-containing protein [Arenibacter sp. F26102]MCK0146213.1 FecR domain-containing protein [Arenibacter sp. F26102]